MAELKLKLYKDPITDKILKVEFIVVNKYTLILYRRTATKFRFTSDTVYIEDDDSIEITITNDEKLTKVISNLILAISKGLKSGISDTSLFRKLIEMFIVEELTNCNLDDFKRKINLIKTDSTSTNIFFDVIAID